MQHNRVFKNTLSLGLNFTVFNVTISKDLNIYGRVFNQAKFNHDQHLYQYLPVVLWCYVFLLLYIHSRNVSKINRKQTSENQWKWNKQITDLYDLAYFYLEQLATPTFDLIKNICFNTRDNFVQSLVRLNISFDPQFAFSWGKE